MKEIKNTESAVCELLLLLFSLGTLLFILHRSGMIGITLRLPGTIEEWIAAILALDAFMAGSLLCWFILPVTTLAFGAAAAAAGSMILELDRTWWRYLLLLLTTVPLHFLISGWSLSTASEIRQVFAGHGHKRHPYGVSLVLMIVAICASALVMYLFQHGLI